MGGRAEQLFQKEFIRSRTDDTGSAYYNNGGIYLRCYCEYRLWYAGMGLQRLTLQYNGAGMPSVSLHMVSFFSSCNSY